MESNSHSNADRAKEEYGDFNAVPDHSKTAEE